MAKRKKRIETLKAQKVNVVIADDTTDVLLVIGSQKDAQDIVLNVQVDTGAAASLMASKFFDAHFTGTKLLTVKEALKIVPSLATNLQDYQKHELTIKGVFMAPVKAIRSLDGKQLEMTQRIVPFLITTEGANIILGRSSTGRKGLNILRHFEANLDRDANDTIDMNQLDKLKELSRKRGFYSSLDDDDDEMPDLVDIVTDDEDSDSEGEVEDQTKVNESKKVRFEETEVSDESFKKQSEDYFKLVYGKKISQVNEESETIMLVNAIPRCPISDETWDALAKVHNSIKGQCC